MTTFKGLQHFCRNVPVAVRRYEPRLIAKCSSYPLRCVHGNIRTLKYSLFGIKPWPITVNMHCGPHSSTMHIHTSAVTCAVPFIGPLLLKLTTPLSRIVFFLLGRRFRKWWRSLPHTQREKYVADMKTNRNRFMGAAALLGGVSFGYYAYHLESTPITGRRRFLLFDNNQLEKVVDIQMRQLDAQLLQQRLPDSHVLHRKVHRVAQIIIAANPSTAQTAQGLQWTVNVIQNDDANAFVLANGTIYVFTGMLNAIRNEDELAGVLGHEMAHTMLNHSAELVSHSGFFNVFSLAIFGALWAFIPTDGLAVIGSWIQSIIEDVLITLPYSRKLEREADEVGLLLAARACYDVRHVPRFWERMHRNAEDNTPNVEWLSTHPSHEHRVEWLVDMLPQALSTHNRHCPTLSNFLKNFNL